LGLKKERFTQGAGIAEERRFNINGLSGGGKGELSKPAAPCQGENVKMFRRFAGGSF